MQKRFVCRTHCLELPQRRHFCFFLPGDGWEGSGGLSDPAVPGLCPPLWAAWAGRDQGCRPPPTRLRQEPGGGNTRGRANQQGEILYHIKGSFRQWPLKRQQFFSNFLRLLLFEVYLHHSSKIKVIMKSENSAIEIKVFHYFCLMMGGSGSGRPKNLRPKSYGS